MVDEIFDRQYQSGRADLHAGLDRAFAALGRSIIGGFEALNRIQFAAPWASARRAVAKKDRAGLA
jgi:hypothetical protein